MCTTGDEHKCILNKLKTMSTLHTESHTPHSALRISARDGQSRQDSHVDDIDAFWAAVIKRGDPGSARVYRLRHVLPRPCYGHWHTTRYRCLRRRAIRDGAPIVTKKHWDISRECVPPRLTCVRLSMRNGQNAHQEELWHTAGARQRPPGGSHSMSSC